MPWDERSKMDKRIEFVIRAVQGIESMRSLCGEFGISRPTGYLWKNRYLSLGTIKGLEERSRKPITCKNKTLFDIENRVVELRRRWGWGAKKLQVLLQGEAIQLPLITINRIIRRNGLITSEDKITHSFTRFEKENPNELWQMDFKGYYKMGNKKCYPLTLIDDHSRYVMGLFALTQTNGYRVWQCLVETFRKYGVPETMLMDHGTPWWGSGYQPSLSKLSVNLIKQGIRLSFSGVRHPQTQGKVERFHRTLSEEIRRRGEPKLINSWSIMLDRIRDDYNNIRPHEALSMEVPAKKYRPSPKEYNPVPKEWIYPMGSEILPVKSAGIISYRGKSYVAGTGLIGDKVCIRRMGTNILVIYRHMIIKEINLSTGKETFLLIPDKV
jgi:transposase InsO family protein